jgi:hypothetical protein
MAAELISGVFSLSDLVVVELLFRSSSLCLFDFDVFSKLIILKRSK